MDNEVCGLSADGSTVLNVDAVHIVIVVIVVIVLIQKVSKAESASEPETLPST